MPFSDAVAVVLAKRTLKRHPTDRDIERDLGGSPTPTSARDCTRFDVEIDGDRQTNLPKRIAMLVVVKALVERGVEPKDISTSLPPLAKRLFRSADGHVDSEQFVNAVAREQQQRGKSFDASRYFCESERLIHFSGRTFALTNQWGGWTGESLATLMRTFGNRGVSVSPASI